MKKLMIKLKKSQGASLHSGTKCQSSCSSSALLLLLFVPNLTKQKDAVDDKGKAAVVKVVESQAELYRLDKNDDASLSKLQSDGRITAEQAKAYKDYHAKQKTSQTVAD